MVVTAVIMVAIMATGSTAVGYSFYAGGGCYRYRWVETRFGLVKRLVNVCGYY
jgi:hypothetical protein